MGFYLGWPLSGVQFQFHLYFLMLGLMKSNRGLLLLMSGSFSVTEDISTSHLRYLPSCLYATCMRPPRTGSAVIVIAFLFVCSSIDSPSTFDLSAGPCRNIS